MAILIAMLVTALAGDWSEDEAARFGGAAPAPIAPSDAARVASWTGGARAEVRDLVAVEARLRQLGATPDQVVLVSARLDWGTRIGGGATGAMRYARTGLTVQAQRLSDGAILQEGRVVEDDRVYDLADPEARARLCTRARSGRLGELTLHTWAGQEAAADALPDDAAILLADTADPESGTTGARTALIALQPGESATLVEVVGPDARRLRVRRAMTVQRGEQVLRLTEGDLQQRICLDF